jgi:hypothetical protein
MKRKALMTVMIGVLCLLFLSTIAWAQMGGLIECQNSLHVCTTNLANAQTNLGVCTTNLSTCQATLTQCIQKTAVWSWDQQLPASTRFVVLSNWIDADHPSGGAAVLDRETGLVWEQSPSMTFFVWREAELYCNRLSTGGRLGWRLPTIQELASLVDPSVGSPPALPSGHPFGNVQSFLYWSATTDAFNASDAWDVNFFSGVVDDGNYKGASRHVWCVRGGQGVDPQ